MESWHMLAVLIARNILHICNFPTMRKKNISCNKMYIEKFIIIQIYLPFGKWMLFFVPKMKHPFLFKNRSYDQISSVYLLQCWIYQNCSSLNYTNIILCACNVKTLQRGWKGHNITTLQPQTVSKKLMLHFYFNEWLWYLGSEIKVIWSWIFKIHWNTISTLN